VSLNEFQVSTYHDRGFLSPIDGFQADEMRRLQRAFDDFERQCLERGGPIAGSPMQFRPHLHQPWAADLVRRPEILDAVESLIGPDILVYHVTIWIKEPGADSYVSWHQDSTYFGLAPFVHVTAWLALTEASEDMGCMRMIPGSHRRGELPLDEVRPGGNLMLRAGHALTVDESSEEVVATPLDAGQFSLHHTLTLHASGPNRAERRRVGLGISYIPTSCRCTARQRVDATLVRGVDRFGHFDLEERPERAGDDSGLARLDRSLQRWNAMRRETKARVLERMAHHQRR